ncbi:MAG: phage holin family protein [Bifidobacteriaceae bacterium]|nr:phage holin family protein [Bifidobacteriaceae bacterium]
MADQPLSETLRRACEQVATLSRTTVELVKGQLSRDRAKIGAGAGLFAVALVLALGVIPLLVLALVWGLVEAGLPAYVAYLITAAAALLLAALAALAGRAIIKQAAASVGETVAAVKESLAALRGTPEPPPEAAADPAGPATPAGPAGPAGPVEV